MTNKFVTIDTLATGKKIKSLMLENGYSIEDIMDYLCFINPQAIYKWFRGETLPRIDVLFALSILFKVHMEELLVTTDTTFNYQKETYKMNTNNNSRVAVYIRTSTENKSNSSFYGLITL